jgi:hypothetical protein
MMFSAISLTNTLLIRVFLSYIVIRLTLSDTYFAL